MWSLTRLLTGKRGGRGGEAVDLEVRSGPQPRAVRMPGITCSCAGVSAIRGKRGRLEWSVRSGNHSLANHCFQWEYVVRERPGHALAWSTWHAVIVLRLKSSPAGVMP